MNNNIFESGNILKSVFQLCIPVVLSMLVVVAYNMVDLYFVSLTNNPYQVAAVSIANPIFLLLMAMGSLVGGGATISISKSLGQKNIQKTKAYASLAAYSMIVIGLLLSLFITFKTDLILNF